MECSSQSAPAADAGVVSALASAGALTPVKQQTEIKSTKRGFGSFVAASATIQESVNKLTHRVVNSNLRKIKGSGKLIGEIQEARHNKAKPVSGGAAAGDGGAGAKKDNNQYKILIRQINPRDNQTIVPCVGSFVPGGTDKDGKRNMLRLVKRDHWDDVKIKHGFVQYQKVYDDQWVDSDPAKWDYLEVSEGDVISVGDFAGGPMLSVGSLVQIVDLSASAIKVTKKIVPGSAAAAAAAPADAVDAGPQIKHRVKGVVQLIECLPDGLTYAMVQTLLEPDQRKVRNMMEHLVRVAFGLTEHRKSYSDVFRFNCSETELADLVDPTSKVELNFVQLNTIRPEQLSFTRQNEAPKTTLCVGGTGYQRITDDSFVFTLDINGDGSTVARLFGTSALALWSNVAAHYITKLQFFGLVNVKVDQSVAGYPLNSTKRDAVIAEMAQNGNDLGLALSTVIDQSEDPVHFAAMGYINTVNVTPQALWDLTIPVDKGVLTKYPLRWTVPEEERPEDPHKFCDGLIVCASTMNSADALGKITPEMVTNGEVRVLIGHNAQYLPFIEMFSQLTHGEGAELIDCLGYCEADYDKMPPAQRPKRPLMPSKFREQPYGFDAENNCLAVPSRDQNATRMIVYLFPESSRWRGAGSSGKFDVSEYHKTGKVKVRHVSALASVPTIEAGDTKRRLITAGEDEEEESD